MSSGGSDSSFCRVSTVEGRPGSGGASGAANRSANFQKDGRTYLLETMTIIISKNGKNAKKVNRSTFERENYLPEYLHDNPESIPLSDIVAPRHRKWKGYAMALNICTGSRAEDYCALAGDGQTKEKGG